MSTLGASSLGGWLTLSLRPAAGPAPVSYTHLDVYKRQILDFVERTPSLEGPVNASSPNPVDNRTLMATVREVLGARIGPSMPRWMLELGAIGIRTETELVLKSRWVLPEKLQAAGFEFAHPKLERALREIWGR